MAADVRSHTRSIIATVVIVAALAVAFVGGHRLPIMGLVDLGFHELGHLLARPLGIVPHFLAGSTTQVLVPLGLGAYFWLSQRDEVASGLMLAWAASAAQDASVYIADAPYERLQLIGGHHDWAYLLGRWNMMRLADELAGLVWFSGLVIGLVGLGVVLAPVVRSVREAREDASIAMRFATAPIREAREALPIGPTAEHPGATPAA
jgi:hypothetical protein